MARAMISPKFYAWDRNGKPLAFGKVYTYQARTNTPKPTYHSEDQIVPNTNPVILSGEGYADIYLDGSYKIVVKDSNDNEIWTADPVTQGGGDGSDTYSQFALTGYYSTPTKVEVLGDYTSAMREGVRITLTTLQDSGRDKEQPSTIVSSVFDGDKTAITITDPLVTPGVKSVSVTNWPFEEIGAIEEFVESNELTFQTPQGQTKETITGIERKVFNQVASVPLGDGQWAAGKVYTAYNEYLNYGGIAYKPAMDTPLPYTTQGSDPTDGPDEGLVIPFAEVTRSDVVLNVSSVYDLQAMPTSELSDGQAAIVHGAPYSYNGNAWVPLGTVNVKAYGAVGDGATDDNVSVTNAVADAVAAKLPVYFPPGDYLMSEGHEYEYGVRGAGSSLTTIRGIDNGTYKGKLITTGYGLNGGFTADGVCSDDPESWSSENYDSFTGHGRTVSVGKGGSKLNDIISKNAARRSGFDCWSKDDVEFINCHAIRCRGEFGDGFYVRLSHDTQFKNCSAYDYTRIGFVAEGNASKITDRVLLENCQADFGHDSSHSYGGEQRNSGFWQENANNVTHINCRATNNDGRQFTFAGNSYSIEHGYVTNNVSYTNCYADGPVAYTVSGLSSQIRTYAVLKGCSFGVGTIREGFRASKNATMTAVNCSARLTTDGAQARVFTVDDDSELIIDGFLEDWTGKGQNYYGKEDTGSISKFSDASPAKITVKNYRTVAGDVAVLKLREPTAKRDVVISIEDSDLFPGRVNSVGSITLNRLNIDLTSWSFGYKASVKCRGAFYISKSNIKLGSPFRIYMEGPDFSFNSCQSTLTRPPLSSHFVFFYNSDETGSTSPRIVYDNCVLAADVNDGPLFSFKSTGATRYDAYSLFSKFNGCTFVNTGEDTDDDIFNHWWRPRVSTVYVINAIKKGVFSMSNQVAEESSIISI